MLSFFFWRSDRVWWTGDQLPLLYSVFIYSSFTSFWVIPYKAFFGIFFFFHSFIGYSSCNIQYKFIIQHKKKERSKNPKGVGATGLTSHARHRLYCIIYFCVSLQSPSMSEGPLISCYRFHDALFIVRKALPEGYLFQASGVTKGTKMTRWSMWKERNIFH